MSTQMMEPPGSEGQILPEFLDAFEAVRATFRFDADAQEYVLGFLRRGTARIRRTAGVANDDDPPTSLRRWAASNLANAATELTTELAPYADREITRDHLETVLQTMCITGYPPFCTGKGISPQTTPAATGSPGEGVQWNPSVIDPQHVPAPSEYA